MFQTYAGTQVLDATFEGILKAALERVAQQPMAEHLKRALLNVVLSAMIYNPTNTFSFLEQTQQT